MIHKKIGLGFAALALLMSLAPEAPAQPPGGAPPAEAPPAGGPVAEALERGNEVAKEAFRLSREGDLETAIDKYREALEIAPELNGARFALARLYAGMSRFEEAHEEFSLLVTANPQDVASHRGKATALILLERWSEARQSLEDSMRTVVPRDGQLAHLLARVLVSAPDASVRNGSLAIELAMWVYEVQKKTAVGETIAMAWAELGEFERAITIQGKMVEIVENAGDERLAAIMRKRLDAYKSNRSWTAEAPLEIVLSTELPEAAG